MIHFVKIKNNDLDITLSICAAYMIDRMFLFEIISNYSIYELASSEKDVRFIDMEVEDALAELKSAGLVAEIEIDETIVKRIIKLQSLT